MVTKIVDLRMFEMGRREYRPCLIFLKFQYQVSGIVWYY